MIMNRTKIAMRVAFYLPILMFSLLVPAKATQQGTSPVETTKLLLQALKENNAELWKAQESSVDNAISSELPMASHGFIDDASRLIKTSKNPDMPFELAYIKDVTVWDKKYAEVSVVFPFEYAGYPPPITIFMLREGKYWKVLFNLSFNAYVRMGDSANNLNETVDFFLLSTTGEVIKREDRSTAVKTEFRMPKELSGKYNSAWEAAPSQRKKGFFLMWLLSGDPAAKRIMDARKSADEELVDKRNYEAFQKLLANISTTSLPEKHGYDSRLTPPITEAQLWYYRALTNPALQRVSLPFTNLIKRFSSDKVWCAKAQMQIAENYVFARKYVEASQAYEVCIANYPDFDSTITAKQKLAALYWKDLKQMRKAVPLIKELAKLGKLPPELPQKGIENAPDTIAFSPRGFDVQDNLKDFDVSPDGNSVYVLYNTTKGRELGVNRLVRYSEGKADVVSEISPMPIRHSFEKEPYKLLYDTVNFTKSALWLTVMSGYGHLLKLSERGKVLGWFSDIGSELISLTPGQPAPQYPWKSSTEESNADKYWADAVFSQDFLYVCSIDREVLKVFDLRTKKAIKRSPVLEKIDTGTNGRPKIALENNGHVLVLSPGNRMILEYDMNGRLYREIAYKSSAATSENQFVAEFAGRPVSIARTPKETFVIGASGESRIAEYDSKGTLVNDYDLSPYINEKGNSIRRIRVDQNNNLYVSVFGSDGEGVYRFGNLLKR